MKKIGLVIKHEFSTRVLKKSFLLTTILVPLIFPLVIGGIVYFAIQSRVNQDQKTVWIVSEGQNSLTFENSKYYRYEYRQEDLDSVKSTFKITEGAYILIYIPDLELQNPAGFQLYAKQGLGITVVKEFESKIERAIKALKLNHLGLTKTQLESLTTNIGLDYIDLSTGTEKEANSFSALGIGYMMGFLIYIFLFVYGTQVMNGIIEEKNSRVVEILLATIRPFDLMMGKLVGIASVGLLQILIWIVLTVVAFSGILTLNEFDTAPQVQELFKAIEGVPFVTLTTTFILYFVGGYFLYAALFAAVGAVVEQASDANQFVLPITLPIIVALLSLMLFVFEDPNSSYSFWLSLFPFTSPIIMTGRISFGVEVWEIVLSLTLLIACIVLMVWLAARIFRIGILIYGAKVNYRVLLKWLLMKS